MRCYLHCSIVHAPSTVARKQQGEGTKYRQVGINKFLGGIVTPLRPSFTIKLGFSKKRSLSYYSCKKEYTQFSSRFLLCYSPKMYVPTAVIFIMKTTK